MPFGLCSAPSTFQNTINVIFGDYLCKFVIVFFDDILIYSVDWKTHVRTPSPGSSHDLKVAPVSHQGIEMCFCINYYKLLGSYNIFSRRCYRSNENLGHHLETPRNVQQLCGFLGLVGYYSRFVIFCCWNSYSIDFTFI